MPAKKGKSADRRIAKYGFEIKAEDKARTIIYVHGIGNKPPKDVLKCQWDRALFGLDLGEKSRLAYWVDRSRYPDPIEAECDHADIVHARTEQLAVAVLRASQPGMDPVEAEIEALAASKEEREFLESVAAEMQKGGESGFSTRVADVEARFILDALTRLITRIALRDVHDFFYKEDRREYMINSLMERIEVGGGPFVIIGHSQGSMVAYEALRRLKKGEVSVPLFVTIGSPLGLISVQKVLRKWAKRKELPVPACVDRWVNVADDLDIVSSDSNLSNDFTPSSRITNHNRPYLNPDSPESPHSGTGYLRTPEVRDAVRSAVPLEFPQVVGDFVIANDLARQLERESSATRHEVLIELEQPEGSTETTAVRGERVENRLREMLGDEETTRRAEIYRHQRYVSAQLTRREVERLQAECADLSITHVWRDPWKRALICDSVHTVQGPAGTRGYLATGKDIHWAVLDTGIWKEHPHFRTYGNIKVQWDCTHREPKPPKAGESNDKHGHGTHVAGIIAGYFEFPTGEVYSGMAPECVIHDYKVLNDRGEGRDSWIIKALDHILQTNRDAGSLQIHGVNLSLGGAFDPSVFGCGHSPLCQMLRLLWRQGVVVCLAAGNEGYRVVRSGAGAFEMNVDLSIGDPANLDEAIAVGSIHKLRPHTYGVSYFSSRGPTADGRVKPDCVAPGEKIWSASLHAPDKPKAPEDAYVMMSGTSMATPHISGLLAAFLSRRREFIGYPDRIREILLRHCTDLGRDPYAQGRGMPNLVQMLANT